MSGRFGCSSSECDVQVKEAAVIAKGEHVARSAALVLGVVDELEVGGANWKVRRSRRPEPGFGWVFPAEDEGAGRGKVIEGLFGLADVIAAVALWERLGGDLDVLFGVGNVS